MSNYQKDLDKIIENINDRSLRPSLLLHACCGPCSSYVLEYLAKYFQITVFYYNPNIYPVEEYQRRFSELLTLYEHFPPVLEGKVQVIEEKYDPEDFYSAVGTREQPEFASEPERGERCRRCYEFRLRRAFEYAATHDFDYYGKYTSKCYTSFAHVQMEITIENHQIKNIELLECDGLEAVKAKDIVNVMIEKNAVVVPAIKGAEIGSLVFISCADDAVTAADLKGN